MSLDHPNKCWRTTAGFSPEWREWEGEVVVFDSYSGDTHAFDAITAFVLETLSAQSQDTQTLMEQVADQFALPPDSELLAYLDKALNQLSSLRLIISA